MSIPLLRLYLADTTEPYTLDDEELGELLARNDDIDAAAAEGWQIKAGKVAEWYNASLDGANLSRSDVFEHCMAMSKMYADKSGSSIHNFGVRVTPEPYSGSEYA